MVQFAPEKARQRTCSRAANNKGVMAKLQVVFKVDLITVAWETVVLMDLEKKDPHLFKMGVFYLAEFPFR